MMSDWHASMMSGWGPGLWTIHWLYFAVLVAAVLYPVGRILKRLGFSPLWSILILVPIVNFVLIWVIAFSDWPMTQPAPINTAKTS